MPRDEKVSEQPDEPLAARHQQQFDLEAHDDEMLDEALAASFPASDPPASHRFD